MKSKITSNIEDYLEAIYQLNSESKKVRVKDIAKKLDINPASVTEILYKLQDLILVEHEKYGKVVLTENGKKIAKKIYSRHKILVEFLADVLQLDKEKAEEDSCKIEHSVSDVTMSRLIKFIEFIQNSPCGKPSWLENFCYYLKNGTYPPNCKDKKKVDESSKTDKWKPGRKK